MICWNRSFNTPRSRSDSAAHPWASTIHSIPLMRVPFGLLLRVPTFRTELAGFGHRLSTVEAELGFVANGCSRRGRGFSRRRTSLLHCIHHGLPHGHAGAQPRTHSSGATAFICCSHWNRLSNFVLGVPSHVTHHAHADSLVEDLL